MQYSKYFKFNKTTKNAVQFVEEDGTEGIGTIYIKKALLNILGYELGDDIYVSVETNTDNIFNIGEK